MGPSCEMRCSTTAASARPQSQSSSPQEWNHSCRGDDEPLLPPAALLAGAAEASAFSLKYSMACGGRETGWGKAGRVGLGQGRKKGRARVQLRGPSYAVP